MTNHNISLFLIPTVLADGTQNDVLSPQIIEVILQLNVFFVENIRTSRRFISSLKLGKVIDDIQFIELTKDTPELETFEALQNLTESAGILSEAGSPGVADPGALAVQHAHDLGIPVVPLVGPSSILLALMGSGMSGQSFTFHGYLPIDKALRKKALQQLERDARHKAQSQIFMETPFRNNQMLEAVLETCLPDTRLCIAANLTAPDQLVKTQSITRWKQSRPDLNKKPSIFIIG